MADVQPPVDRAPHAGLMPAERTLSQAPMPNAKRVRARNLHLDILQEFGKFGLIPGTIRGWRQDRETVDG
jgi:hypothetical protein